MRAAARTGGSRSTSRHRDDLRPAPAPLLGARTGYARVVIDDTDNETHRRVATAISTSTLGNATAFGFSITITGSFGVAQSLIGSPTVGQVLLFAVAAALVVGVLEGAVTRGFRERVGAVPPEVAMLGTAQNFISVALGIGAAAGAAKVIGSGAGWPACGAVGTVAFLLAESSETLLAEVMQKRRGDPDADKQRDD
jgi:hypothetical protein